MAVLISVYTPTSAAQADLSEVLSAPDTDAVARAPVDASDPSLQVSAEWPVAVRLMLAARIYPWNSDGGFEQRLDDLGHGSPTFLRGLYGEVVYPWLDRLWLTGRVGMHGQYWPRATAGSTHIVSYELLVGAETFLLVRRGRLGIKTAFGGAVAALRYGENVTLGGGLRLQADAYWSHAISERTRTLIEVGVAFRNLPGFGGEGESVQLGGWMLGFGLEFGRE